MASYNDEELCKAEVRRIMGVIEFLFLVFLTPLCYMVIPPSSFIYLCSQRKALDLP